MGWSIGGCFGGIEGMVSGILEMLLELEKLEVESDAQFAELMIASGQGG